ncbi:hypothetical protein [Streptomyces sp. NPDC005385]|uniref:hypothetical protein n=1 Tax=Streptomyces sp. NPDC005385 TaxID=3157039 RepID=UPI0033A5BEFD
MASQTDARQSEYTTYAPPGEKCRKCQRTFKRLETCRRVAIERASAGPSADRYEHAECPR